MSKQKFLQRWLSNAQLRAAWLKAVPKVDPTERDLTAFALGVECGQSLQWQVVTMDTAKDRVFNSRQDAIDYITMNDPVGDWCIRPLTPVEMRP